MMPLARPSLMWTLGFLAVATAQPAVFLADLTGAGELSWCFDEPVEPAVCITSTDSTTSRTSDTTTGTGTTTSRTSTSRTTTTTASSTTCFKYDDCFDTCAYMASKGACELSMCSTCIHAHMCDFTCGICATNTTSTETSVSPSTTATTVTTVTTTAVSLTATSITSVTVTGTTGTSVTTTLSETQTSETPCYMINLKGDTFCDTACQAGGCSLGSGMCQVMFCPGCSSAFAGMCDKTCGFCTTQTNTSSTSMTTGSTSATSQTTTYTTTLSSTTSSLSTTSATTTTVSTVTLTATSTTNSFTTGSTTVTTTTVSTTTSMSTTTCFKYEDCMTGCPDMAANGECSTTLCPTCSAAHTCDMTCGFCATDITSTDSETHTTSSATSTSTITVTTATTATITTASATTATTTASESSSTTETTFSVCVSINVHPMGDAFCNTTCRGGLIAGCPDPCETLYCPSCPGTEAGMCDESCGFCTTLTDTISSTTTATESTRTKTTETTTRSTFTTTASTTSVTPTSLTSSTTSSCFTYPDLLANCAALTPGGIDGNGCQTVFCPTCQQARQCDTTCYHCANPTTATTTFTTTSSSSSDTTGSVTTGSDTTGSTTVSTLSVSTSTVSSTTRTTSTATSTSTVSETTSTGTSSGTDCFKNNSMGDAWCASNCNGVDCPVETCQQMFCPTCTYAGWCDLACDYCSNKLTQTTLSETSTTKTTTTGSTTTETFTCTPCKIEMNMPIPLSGSGCSDPIPCGGSVTCTTLNFDCLSSMTMSFYCDPNTAGSLAGLEYTNFGGSFSNGSYFASWGAQPSAGSPSDIQFRTPTITSVSGSFDLKCQSCGISTYDVSLLDADDQCGTIDLTLSFGPNLLNGVVNEDVVSGYAVYLVSTCTDPSVGSEYSELLATVAATPDSTAGQTENECACNSMSKYSVAIKTTLPSAGDHRLMVVPVLQDGSSYPIGKTTTVIFDSCKYSAIVDLEYCFDIGTPDYPVCTTTQTSATTGTTTTATLISDSRTYSTITTSGTTTTTITTCFMYQDCYDTCAELAGLQTQDNCVDMFCPTCPHARMCDTTCGFCAGNVTTTKTSTLSTLTSTLSSVTGTTTTSASTVTATATSVTVTTGSGTTTTATSTWSVCYSVDLNPSDWCNSSCLPGPGDCHADPCATLFCPNCADPYAGTCDKTCGYCTTMTNSSTTSITSSTTGTTITTMTTTTRTWSTTTSTSASSMTGSTATDTTTTGTTSTTTSMTTSASTTTQTSSTSITSTASTTSGTTVSSTTLTTDTVTTTTVTTASDTTASGTTETPCLRVNIETDTFCQNTINSNASACVDLFAPNAPGNFAGLCDRSCNYCTTLTVSSTSTLSSGTDTTATETSSTSVTTTATTSTSASTTSRTTRSWTTTTTITTVTGTTFSGTTTTCYKYDDCFSNCLDMTADCDTVFCPTCVNAYMCDFSCGFCAIDPSTTETTGSTSITTTDTTGSVTTDTTTATISTTTATTFTTSVSTGTTVTETSQTLCNATNLKGDAFCNASCVGVDCPQDVCATLFCLTCPYAGYCDLKCGYCTAKITHTQTSSMSATTETTTVSTASVTQTCRPCKVNLDADVMRASVGSCSGFLQCGSSCDVDVFDAGSLSSCMSTARLTFECLDDVNGDWETEGAVKPEEVWTASIPVTGVTNSAITGTSVDQNLFSDTTVGNLVRGAKLTNVQWPNGNLAIGCKSCGIADFQVTGNSLCTELDVSFKFGPNVVVSSSQVDESLVSKYAVFLVKECDTTLLTGTLLSDAVAVIEKTSATISVVPGQDPATCACEGAQTYEFSETITLPHDTNYRLMIVPVLTGDIVVPLGITTDNLHDFCDTTTMTSTATAPPGLQIVQGAITLETGNNVDSSAFLGVVRTTLADYFVVEESQVTVSAARRLQEQQSPSGRRLPSVHNCNWEIRCWPNCGRVWVWDNDYTDIVPLVNTNCGATCGGVTVTAVSEMEFFSITSTTTESETTTTVTETTATTATTGTGTSKTTTATTVTGTTKSTLTTTATTKTSTITTTKTVTSTSVFTTTMHTVTLTTTTVHTVTGSSVTTTGTTVTSKTGTTVTGTDTTKTSVTGTTTTVKVELEGQIEVAADAAVENVIRDLVAKPAIMAIYSVTEEQITQLSVQQGGGGRRLQDNNLWQVTYAIEVTATAKDAIVANFDASAATTEFNSKLQDFYSGASVASFSAPQIAGGATTTVTTNTMPVRTASASTGGSSAATKASGGTVVYVLGVAAFAVMLVMVVATCLCKRRLMSCLGIRRGNNVQKQARPSDTEQLQQPSAQSHDWDCDNRAGQKSSEDVEAGSHELGAVTSTASGNSSTKGSGSQPEGQRLDVL